jgi:hypothetical protein
MDCTCLTLTELLTVVLMNRMEFDLIGEDRTPVQWEWDTKALEDNKDIFRVEPMSGVVHMQEITSISVWAHVSSSPAHNHMTLLRRDCS